MKILGTKINNGLGLGKCYYINNKSITISNKKIEECDAAKEVQNVYRNIDKLIEMYEDIIKKTDSNIIRDLSTFNKTVLGSSALKKRINNLVKDKLYNSNYAINDYFNEKAKVLDQTENPYLKERIMDVLDLRDRLIRINSGIKEVDISSVDEDIVLVGKEITPTTLLSNDLTHVKGLIAEIGGKTSHIAILATSLGIPAVFGVDAKFKKNELLFVNADNGTIENNLNNEQLEAIQGEMIKAESLKKEFNKYKTQKVTTKDNKSFDICINTGDLLDLNRMDEYEFDGVGLFRSEFLYLNKVAAPSEDYLFNVYKSFAEKLGSKPLIVRTLDIGGDKQCPFINIKDEMNPFLGLRAIRYCLEDTEIFKTSLRAILRASAYGNVMIMYPMISSLDDVIEANKILNEAKKELELENIKFNKKIKVGIMVEVPSVAVMAEQIIKYVDFYSIGTNDLVQYSLAVDRINSNVGKYYNTYNPAVLRLIQNTILSTKKSKRKFTGLCGEFAADPLGIILLVGLELDEFSVNIGSLPRVKKYISMLNYKETKKFVRQLLNSPSAIEIEKELEKFAKKTYGKFYLR